MTDAVTNYGVQLKRGDGSATEVFAAIAEVVNITPPGVAHVEAEATSHASGWREFIGTGLKELEEFTVDINYVPDDGDHDATTGLLADAVSGEPTNYQLVFPDSTQWDFTAIVKLFKPQGMDAKAPDTLKAQVTFRPTGAPTLA